MQLLEKYAVTCSSLTMYRAKKIVLNNLKTDHIAVYAKMKKYGNAIIAMNPATCVKVSLTAVPGTNPRFERFFLSFKASQTGFKKGCRPLIGIDGCHLTGQFGDVMLSANALEKGKCQVFHLFLEETWLSIRFSVAKNVRVFPHDHVHWYYNKEALKLTYSGVINPIPEESRWPEYQCQHIDPPAKRAKVGKLKKNRKRAADEPRAL
ncbi:hypothetical protein Dsin_016876 [Dipteronia sinensis]|uniref:Uncharacterized protein n=1 Tax=Dipteronia sinensis TaxID=43782 RepID=A0AAE0AFE0_9ROSI|nr:hypothetical protein Dsin_016876 [Dipteronia sinensis]